MSQFLRNEYPNLTPEMAAARQVAMTHPRSEDELLPVVEYVRDQGVAAALWVAVVRGAVDLVESSGCTDLRQAAHTCISALAHIMGTRDGGQN